PKRKRRRGRRLNWTIACCFFVPAVLVLLLTLVPIGTLRFCSRLQEVGRKVAADVTDADFKIRGRRIVTSALDVEYEFTPPGGSPVRGKARLSHGDMNRAEDIDKNPRIDVLYLPEEPSRHLVVEEIPHERRSAWIFLFLILGGSVMLV